MTLTASQARVSLQKFADKQRAQHSQRYFKTGPGEYAVGDVFIGVRVPLIRKTAHAFKRLPKNDVLQLLRDPIHEVRLLALIIITLRYTSGTETARKAWYESYLKNTAYINNWDLVDSSAHKIVGEWLSDKPRHQLTRLASSQNLWERRIAVIATFAFIRRKDFSTSIELAERMLDDREDLIHKAVGWMLREIGNKQRSTLDAFLRQHYQTMPRTMLRYAIEKLPEKSRQDYLKGRI